MRRFCFPFSVQPLASVVVQPPSPSSRSVVLRRTANVISTVVVAAAQRSAASSSGGGGDQQSSSFMPGQIIFQKNTKSSIAKAVETVLMNRSLMLSHNSGGVGGVGGASRGGAWAPILRDAQQHHHHRDVANNSNNNSNNSSNININDDGEEDYESGGWVPITQLSRMVPEHVLEELERYKNGMREVIATELARHCEIEHRKSTGTWMARFKPVDPIIVELARNTERVLLQQPPTYENKHGMSFSLDKIIPQLDVNLRRQVELKFRHITRALERCMDLLPDLNFAVERDIGLLGEKRGTSRTRIVFIRRPPVSAQQQQQPRGQAGVTHRQSTNQQQQVHHQRIVGAGGAGGGASHRSQQQGLNPFSSSFDRRAGSHGSGGGFPPQQQQQHFPQQSSSSASTGGADNNFVRHQHQQQQAAVLPAPPQELSALPDAPATPAVVDMFSHFIDTEHQDSCFDAGYVRTEAKIAEKASVNATSLLEHIPTFFIPVDLLLGSDPHMQAQGYTLDHLQQYFARTNAVQIVTLPENGKSYIRFHGRTGDFDMTKVGVANEHYAKFAPDPTLAEPFLDVLRRQQKIPSSPSPWMLLKQLLEAVPEDVVGKLPYQGSEALLYFAQLQHLFLFSPENGGMVAAAAPYHYKNKGNDSTTTSDGSSNNNNSNSNSVGPALVQQTSPCPLLYNQVHRLAQRGKAFPVDVIERLLPRDAVTEFKKFFPSWEAFVAAHGQEFVFLPPSSSSSSSSRVSAAAMVMDNQKQQSTTPSSTTEQGGSIALKRAYYRDELREQGAPLQHQLQYAVQNRTNRGQMRLRRKLALERNPDHPLLDVSNLVTALHSLMPDDDFIAVHDLKHAIPEEVWAAIPRSGLFRLFLNHRDEFMLFDLRDRFGNFTLYVAKPGALPELPMGAVTEPLTEKEVVQFLVQRLHFKGSKGDLLVSLMKRMPAITRERLRKAEDLLELVACFPESFVTISLKSDHTLVQMVRPPTEEEMENNLRFKGLKSQQPQRKSFLFHRDAMPRG